MPLNVLKRSVGPLPVSSRVAADSTLPTTRLKRWWLSSSIGPFGGTPTCQYPTRPGASCTVVNGPGSSTSIVGAVLLASAVSADSAAVR